MFKCECERSDHFHSRLNPMLDSHEYGDEEAEHYILTEYGYIWVCKDCFNNCWKVGGRNKKGQDIYVGK